MATAPIHTYYEAYYYFELYEDYLQVRQSSGAIPYPSVLKEDGKKFFFKDIEEMVFFKEIEVVGEGEHEEEIAETIYSCKIKSKDGALAKIKSFISWEGRNKENKIREYYDFVNLLIEKTRVHSPRLYTSTGMLSRVDKAVPALKVAGITVASVSVFGVVTQQVIEMGEFAGYFFDSPFAGILGVLSVGGFYLGVKYFVAKLKKKTTIEHIQREYLPQ